MKMLKTLLILTVLVLASCGGNPPPVPPPPPSGPTNPGKGPTLSVKIPELYSPDPDDENYKFVVPISVTHTADIKDWSISVQSKTGNPFYETRGNGNPPTNWEWNGKNTAGDRYVQSLTDYNFKLTVTDNFNNASTSNEVISVDILFIREGNKRRIVIPAAIVFPPDSADFKRLDSEVMKVNSATLQRIGKALNRYPDYKVTVEGHANPTTPPGAARTAEENGTAGVVGLKPLSEARAKSIVEYLVANCSVARARLSYVGIGGTRTVAEYNNPGENYQNRRVEFVLQK